MRLTDRALAESCCMKLHYQISISLYLSPGNHHGGKAEIFYKETNGYFPSFIGITARIQCSLILTAKNPFLEPCLTTNPGMIYKQHSSNNRSFLYYFRLPKIVEYGHTHIQHELALNHRLIAMLCQEF